MTIIPKGAKAMIKTADISKCENYRYRLTRHWGKVGDDHLRFIMLNPSTADADIDDPTIRSCISMAKRENLAGIEVVNLFALRTPDPSELKVFDTACIGPENDKYIEDLAISAYNTGSPIVCAWGNKCTLFSRNSTVIAALKAHGCWLMAPGITKGGHPRHPLYNNSPLIDFI